MGTGCRPGADAAADEPASQITGTGPLAPHEKDFENFTLPPRILAVAPRMGEHLLRLVPYNAPRFKVKPRFVFVDEEALIPGPTSTLVARLNMLHLAYYHGDTLRWSGSLLIQVGYGTRVIARDGYSVTLAAREDAYRLTFADGEKRFTAPLPLDADWADWIESGPDRVYAHYYVFPRSLVIQHGPDEEETAGRHQEP